jgi:hypothetical protein
MTDNASRRSTIERPHVESWFFRANHPTEPRASGLKATLLCGRAGGPSVAEAWCAIFDGDRTFAAKLTVPVGDAAIEPPDIRVGPCRFHLDPAAGVLAGEAAGASWDLRYRRLDGALGEPLCLLPTRKLVDAAVPKNKLLTPVPAARFEGVVRWGDRTVPIDGWLGMQGHNWGPEHARSYAWGQCLFTDVRGEPFAMVEGASGRVRVGPFTTPVLSLLAVRHQGREYRFDRIVDTWNQRADIAFPAWSLRMTGRDGEAELGMEADPRRMVRLGYENPDGSVAWCLNSKLAAVTLRVNPSEGDGFTCRSAHGGALEFLTREADPPLPQSA